MAFSAIDGKRYIILPIDPAMQDQKARLTNNFHTDWHEDGGIRIFDAYFLNVDSGLLPSLKFTYSRDKKLWHDDEIAQIANGSEMGIGGDEEHLYFANDDPQVRAQLLKQDYPAIILIEKGLPLAKVREDLARRSQPIKLK